MRPPGRAASPPRLPARSRSGRRAFLAGAGVGTLGGLIGLGGAEFRLPLLITLFGFVALHGIVLNKAMSLVVVLAALPARLTAVPLQDMAVYWDVAVNLLGGSLLGAWAGAAWATRARTATLHRVLVGLLVLMAAALVWAHVQEAHSLGLHGTSQVVAGLVAGWVVGVVAAVMGVAGGELLIPAIVLLYGIDIKLAGSLSLAVSLPTMLVGFARYSRDPSFAVLRDNGRFALAMAAGSVVGAVAGGLLLGTVPEVVLVPALGALLLVSAAQLWRDTRTAAQS